MDPLQWREGERVSACQAFAVRVPVPHQCITTHGVRVPDTDHRVHRRGDESAIPQVLAGGHPLLVSVPLAEELSLVRA